MIRRNITSDVREALADTPVVLLCGARQVGKSTLARQLATEGFGGDDSVTYLTLDDATLLARAESDPDGFIRQLQGATVIDEVQRAPGLLRAMKLVVDENRRPGRFLLTGSANVLMLPRLSESLAGRMELLTLWPFSQGELLGRKEGFVDAVFGDALPGAIPVGDMAAAASAAETSATIWERVVQGGFPEAVARPAGKRRSRWFSSYLTTILQRDIRELANIEGLTQLPRLLQLLAARSGSLSNWSEVSRSAGIPNSTLKRYLALLQATYLVKEIPAWSANLSKRLVKSPKVHVTDTGLAADLMGMERPDGGPAAAIRGGLVESFVAMELEKQRTWARRRIFLHHFRTARGEEIDLILEDPQGALIGIEVKMAGSVNDVDFKGLRVLQSLQPDVFHRGIVLYLGQQVVPFGPRLHAVPVSALWQW